MNLRDIGLTIMIVCLIGMIINIDFVIGYMVGVIFVMGNSFMKEK